MIIKYDNFVIGLGLNPFTYLLKLDLLNRIRWYSHPNNFPKDIEIKIKSKYRIVASLLNWTESL